MLKFFYRLKRRHGVVLFAVIAIMTLLIAMATTAYFTARASYQTVVSNYDFSQTYLSAISISDMLIEAVTQDTNMPGTVTKDGSGKVTNATLNFYQKLKDEVQKLKSKTPGTDAAKIVGYSHNVNGHTASTSDILDAAANNPVASGIFDAVKVEIAHVGTDKKEPGTGLDICHFAFTTTVYYRGTTITVQDTVINKSGEKVVNDENMFNRFFTSTALTVEGREKGASRVVLIDSHEINADAYFENEYTVFGNRGGTAQQYVLGSITSSGSVYFGQLNCSHMSDTATNQRNDWFIGKDLVLTGDAQVLDLHGSNLFVGGDLVICHSGPTISAKDIYVQGNVYVVHGSNDTTFNGNLHVKGSIIDEPTAVHAKFAALNSALTPQGITVSDDSSKGKASQVVYGPGYSKKAWNDTEPVKYSNIKPNKEENPDMYIEVDETKGLVDALTEKTEQKNYSNYTVKEDVLNNVLDVDFNKPTLLPESWAVPDPNAIKDAPSLTPVSYTYQGLNVTGTGTWTFKAANKLTYKVVGTATNSEGDEVPVTYEYEVTIESDGKRFVKTAGDVPNVKLYSNGDLGYGSTNSSVDSTGKEKEWARIYKEPSGMHYTIDLPASTTGYVLGLKNTPQPNGQMTYNIHTIKDQTTPIVLKANFNDGSGLVGDDGTTTGYNAFSWRGNTTGGNGDAKKTIVQLVSETSTASSAEGNVIFELGNYRALVDSEGNPVKDEFNKQKWGYVQYKRADDGSINIPTYYDGERFCIGTKNQVDKLITDSNFTSDSVIKSLYDGNKPPYPASGCDNRIMIVSNKNNGIAFDGSPERHITCGYFYAPNGVYHATNNSMTCPVFGGMIVSVYDTKQDKFWFCSPDPRIISDLLSVMDEESLGGKKTTVEGIWYTSADYGKNYLG